MRKCLAVALIAHFSFGCSTSTKVISSPVGALVTMNDAKTLGTTPLQIDAQIFAWTTYTLKVQKEGYASAEVVLKSQQPVSLKYLAVCVCSLFTLWPLGLVSDFEFPEYLVNLQPLDSESSTALHPEPLLVFSSR